jgi:hypothetical protein
MPNSIVSRQYHPSQSSSHQNVIIAFHVHGIHSSRTSAQEPEGWVHGCARRCSVYTTARLCIQHKPVFSYTLPYDLPPYIIQCTQTQILLHLGAFATCICTASARTHRKVYRTWTHFDRPDERHVSFGVCFRSRGVVVASLGVMGWWRGCFVLLYLAQGRMCEA